ncbi:MAG: hypothetical protein CFE45_18340 [Burkholderiales bacterium PBB5]|nr:MAG: hypothetical protein CFE45_18340 [Burkholderiales bacterium PBB5]
MTPPRPLRIGGASGFWGDSSVGAPQLVASGGIDVEDGRIAHFGLGIERPPDAPRHPVERIDPARLAAGEHCLLGYRRL